MPNIKVLIADDNSFIREGMRIILTTGEQPSGVLLNLAILLAFALVLALTAAYKFGRNREVHSFI